MSLTRVRNAWVRFWMRKASLSRTGRLATRLALSAVSGHFYDRIYLSNVSPFGYVAPEAVVNHRNVRLGRHIYLDDRVLLYGDKSDGLIELGDKVHLHRDTILQTGAGGVIRIGARSSIQPRNQLSAYCGVIEIGHDVQIAPACAFYPYNHQIAPGRPIREQELVSKGGIVIEDDVWLGYGVIVLDGVRIGRGAVVGAGSVVTKDVPAGAIAVGSPARVVRMRG